MNKKRIIK